MLFFFKKKRKKVGLALGGGGARCIAHLGVLKALKTYNIPIDFIAGTSGGAFVGAAYAYNLPLEKIIEVSKTLTWGKIAGFSFHKQGLLSDQPLSKIIEKYLGRITFSNLKIPFTAVATDLLTGKAAGLNQPDLLVEEAVMASIAFPGIFIPVKIGNNYYCDGGVSANLPVSFVRKMGADVVIAVDVLPDIILTDYPKNAFSVVDRAIDIAFEKASALDSRKAQVLLRPIKEPVTSLELKKNDHLIKLGQDVVLENLAKIKRIVR